MTREEAIEVIEQDIPCEHDKDLIEALGMAISALSDEGEYIKKEDTIKAFDMFAEYESNLTNEDWVRRIGIVINTLPTYSFPDREKETLIPPSEYTKWDKFER